MGEPIVSIVIPFYENVFWLKQAVNSVLAQTYKNYEIIVINDGSMEDLTAFLEKYEDKIVYKCKKNGGPASARNLGIEIATGKYIAFLDSDDLWYDKKLEMQIEFMENNDFAWSHTLYEKFTDSKKYQVSKFFFSGYVYPKILYSCPIATPCIIVKKTVFDNNKNLRFNENMRYGQDYYLWVNISQKFKLGLVNATLSKVRIRGSNAALKVRVQMIVRGKIWEHIKEHKEQFINNYEIENKIEFAYAMCKIGGRIIEHMEKLKVSTRVIEAFARVAYVIPWLIFKTTFKNKSI